MSETGIQTVILQRMTIIDPRIGPVVAPVILSPRRMDVLRGVADGLSNREIGEQCGIATETVKWHVADLLSEFAARNRAHLIALAFRAGVLA